MATRAAIYRRVSTSAQEDGTSLENQRDKCLEYVATQDYEVVADFCDTHSGADLWHRPRLQEALDGAERGQFDVLVVYHTDRLSRDADHLAFLRVVLKRASVRVESVRNPIKEDFSGQLIAAFEALFAQHERARIQSRTVEGRLKRINEGRLQPGSDPLIGYRFDDPAKGKKGKYLEDTSKSWIVRRVFRKVLEGKSLRQVAQGLNNEGIPTAKGRQWSGKQIRDIIRHPYYRGFGAANRYASFDNGRGKRGTKDRPESEWIATPGIVPALVEEAIWYAANERLERNKRERTRPYDDMTDALLRAGFVKCRWCGGFMSVHRQHDRVYYRCNNAHFGRSSCKGKAIEATKLDTFIWNLVLSWIADPGVLLHEAQRNRPQLDAALVEDLATFDAGLARLKAEQDNLARALGKLSDEAAAPILERLTQLANEHAALLAERRGAEERMEAIKRTDEVFDSIREQIDAYAAGIGDWTYEQKRELLHRMGVQVTVEKHGVGKARFWVDVAPPWPEGVEWYANLFGPVPNGPFEQGQVEAGDDPGEGSGEPAGTNVVALVEAAIGSKTASQMSGWMSCASLATRSRSAVWPRALAPGAAET